MKSWTEISGGLATLFGVACPVCIPAIASVLAGAGLLTPVAILLRPLFWLLILVFWYGLARAWQQHKNIWPLILGVGAAALTYWTRYVWYFRAAAYAEISWYDWRIMLPALALLGIALWNRYLLNKKNIICKK